jgi:hypothetical protein
MGGQSNKINELAEEEDFVDDVNSGQNAHYKKGNKNEY